MSGLEGLQKWHKHGANCCPRVKYLKAQKQDSESQEFGWLQLSHTQSTGPHLIWS